MTILESHLNGQNGLDLTQADVNALQAEIAALKAQNAALRAKPPTRVTIKVSEKGAVSIYGLGRFPVTLYQGQMTKLMALKDEVLAFIEANQDKLAVKGE